MVGILRLQAEEEFVNTGRTGMMIDDKECVILSSVAMLRPNETCNSFYLKYALESNIVQEQIRVSMAGSAMPRITLDKLVEFWVFLPPFREQIVIANQLNQATYSIDSLIAQKQSLLVRLREYRSSLISECVTGKVKVPGVKED